ncbi:hypothetical protein INS49_004699 [Diaporthe citri]|uniref:uncharacterized protein n=1 Tax=Diaporthe citri TaxID=83186 RepID=UPI001C7FCB0B|nr:uncharacterized protein INS49_004699 [Diaporthe citri]KAG6354681.1 hypothetical protein INS49_004699 [Diaporthe citri]
MPSSHSSSWSTMSGNGYRDNGWGRSYGGYDPRLFNNNYQGPYRINPQQQYWGNSRIMNWIPRPATGSWTPYYAPDYRGWR